MGWIKADVDGVVSKTGDKGAGGMVFRDHDGAFRGGFCHVFPSVSNPDVAELLACRRAVKLAMEMNILKLHVEMDCKAVVSMLNDPTKNLSAAGPINQELKELLRTRMDFKVS